ncbi:MAG: hypothetical protein A2648_02110 [Candidatus Lloydbacteria bacterium RIFCSPHIGHO2_01_FULL_41_20]|uniref:Uncharacterized protein n=1 Tax=Candidatus Lloydbacteria bacterium RIFCSPHIGHO2_01_FULL_41_20 TaxID=1798657 RepID=A0A1G2CR46_9BACT|nr:MAG: hypothetical protein A2648_02110 [Candidatus Lloydbacteria bacterium RIFCSPHIGHO2_01_FULL_41_20]
MISLRSRAGKKEGGWGEGIFARPSLKVFQNSAFGFSLKKVRISFKVWSQETRYELVFKIRVRI